MEARQEAQMALHEAHDAHHAHGKAEACPHCLADPRRPGSSKVAWAIAGIAVAALLVVLFLGVGSAGGNLVALTALPLLALIACPLVMGGMMWMMMRKGH